MDKEAIFTTVIPIILILGMVYYNMRKMQKNLNKMKNDCGGGCSGCAHSSNCNKPEKEDEKS
ncbi:FeoB-associated Cys-rich membrane protein [Anaerotignum propionicum]|uniref:Virus attachment protein p12 family n=1 Tax=Anaerotignum propionicum DSM 1682 TaxID=991789 RepID=A0A0X1U7W1_ANAPI|nr:FeoB-associated Cys-rich membrane protein [Anaerotignum propionicum]AMJ41024.1 virus attachment protein p12 family protein [Anaerotignum propionicum DSM 1682]SHE61605.1 Virus attachment protein p12 family [[Clostridium] propionicum DSM 1682] [Anaerotignum propionicum DSM 1682]